LGTHPAINPKPLQTVEPISIPTDNPNGSAVLALRMPGLDSPGFPGAGGIIRRAK
jgi:hypothetical protein